MSTVDATSTNSILNDYLKNQSATNATATSEANKTALSSSTGSLTTFLKILTTQLKNQDPTSATDTNQFTQELVQFASAEQQINTNSKLDTISNLLKASSGVAGSLSYIDKYVEVPTTNKLPLQNGASTLSYTLDSAATDVSITVKDADGKTVAILKGTGVAGENHISWDGKDANDVQLADGAYTFSIGAKNSFGATVNATDYKTIGKVTSVATNDDGTVSLGLGNMSILSKSVNAIYTSGSLPSATPI